jgi:hypothetical protein
MEAQWRQIVARLSAFLPIGAWDSSYDLNRDMISDIYELGI